MNTGFKKYTILEQYNLDTGQLTGITKPNSPLDPDYINNVVVVVIGHAIKSFTGDI